MRRQLEGRPLLALAAGLAGGLAWHVAPLAVLLALPFAVFRRTVLFGLIGIALGIYLAPYPADGILTRGFVEGSADVAGVPRFRNGRTEFELVVGVVRWSASLGGRPDIMFGDRIQIKAISHPLRDGGVDDYARLQGLEGRLQVVDWHPLERGSVVAGLSDRWRRSFADFVELRMPPAAATLTEALCLNMDGTLDAATRDRLRATGTIHIISASGLHVFVLVAFLTGLLSNLPMSRPIQLAILAGLLGLYAMATGLNAPVVRSVVMSLVGLSAYLFRRDRDALSALAFAAIAYLLWRPRGIFDLGFQLSFVTVAGLALFGPHDREPAASGPDYLRRAVLDALRVSWIAFVASAPLVARMFGTVSLVALPANLLIGFVVPAIVIGGLSAHLFSLVWAPLGLGVLVLVEGWCGWILRVLEWLGDFPWAQVQVPSLPIGLIVVLYGALTLTWRERHVRP